jgi:type II secretory pathway component PulF
MKLYYTAVTHQGKRVSGIIEAKNTSEVAAYLRKHEFYPIKIGISQAKPLLSFTDRFQKVSFKDLVFFTRQLSSMLSSGLTLMQSFQILKNQMQNPKMKAVVVGIVSNIEEGKSFGTAIEGFPQVFSPVYTSLVKAAEAGGVLDKVLLRLADNLEKEQKLRGTIKSAMIYPIIVIITMFIVVVVMLIFVVPQLSSLYEGLNAELPLTTRIVLELSKLVQRYILLFVIAVGVLVFLFQKWHRTPGGTYAVDSFLLKIPLFGKLVKLSVMTEFTRTFGLLAGTGTLVVDALQKSANSAGNVIYKNAIIAVAKRVEKGVSIGDAMAASNVFPPLVVEMTRIGEQTGKLDESLTKISEYFEREVDTAVKGLTTAMEPIILVILAVGVGFLVISIITPIYNLLSNF